MGRARAAAAAGGAPQLDALALDGGDAEGAELHFAVAEVRLELVEAAFARRDEAQLALLVLVRVLHGAEHPGQGVLDVSEALRGEHGRQVGEVHSLDDRLARRALGLRLGAQRQKRRAALALGLLGSESCSLLGGDASGLRGLCNEKKAFRWGGFG